MTTRAKTPSVPWKLRFVVTSENEKPARVVPRGLSLDGRRIARGGACRETLRLKIIASFGTSASKP